MPSRFIPKLTYANVIATIALFVALGGVAVAAGLPRNSVCTKQLKRGAVTPAKLRKAAVTSGKIAPGAVTPGKIGPNAVGPSNIGNGAITSAKIGTGAVIAKSIKNNVVTTNKLNGNAVTSAKLANDAVTTAKLNAGSVTNPILANGSVTANKLSAKFSEEAAPILGNLKAGQTVRGVFDVGGTVVGKEAGVVKNTSYRDSVAFQSPLAGAVTPNVMAPGTISAACPGLGAGNAAPLAAAGQLCVYITAATPEATLTVDANTNSRLGFGLLAQFKNGEADNLVQGVWAVTAP
jgi:hypothetical protein